MAPGLKSSRIRYRELRVSVKGHFGGKRLYQPSITRLPSLLCLIVASLVLIALVEVACRRLPAHDANGFVPSLHRLFNTTGTIKARNADPYPQGCFDNSEQREAHGQATDAGAQAAIIEEPTNEASSYLRPAVTSTQNALDVEKIPDYLSIARDYHDSVAAASPFPTSDRALAARLDLRAAATSSIQVPSASVLPSTAYVQLSDTSSSTSPHISLGDKMPATTTEQAIMLTAAVTDYLPLSDSTTPPETATTAPTDYLPLSDSTTPLEAATTASTDYLPLSDSTTPPISAVGAPPPATNLQLPDTSSSTPDPSIGTTLDATNFDAYTTGLVSSQFPAPVAPSSFYLPISNTPPPTTDQQVAATLELPNSNTGITLDATNFDAYTTGLVSSESLAASAARSFYLPISNTLPPTTDQNLGTKLDPLNFNTATTGNMATPSAVPHSSSLPISEISSPATDQRLATALDATYSNVGMISSINIAPSPSVSDYLPLSATSTPTLNQASATTLDPNLNTATMHSEVQPSSALPLAAGISISVSTTAPPKVAFTSANPTIGYVLISPTMTVITSSSLVKVPPATSFRTGEFDGAPFTIGSGGLLIMEGQSFYTASETTATLSDGKIVVVVGPTGAVSMQEVHSRANSTQEPAIFLTPHDYVIGAFIPTILAVVFSIPWQILSSTINEIEPFYQLHGADGALAEDSLALDYRASTSIIATITALRKRHYVVWFSGAISLITLPLAPLASETVFVGFVGDCSVHTHKRNCFPVLSVYPVAARLVQGILAVIAIMAAALAIAINRRKTGVYANPLSIAGLATLFQDNYLIEDFRRLNAYLPTSKAIRDSFQGNRYAIDTYVEADGSMAYGITITHHNTLPIRPGQTVSRLDGNNYASVALNTVDGSAPATKPSSSPWVHPATVMVFAVFVCGLEVLVLYYGHTGGDTGFERFMDSAQFGVSFLFTAVGVSFKMYWSLLDDEIRSMEPYRQLLHGEAKAADSILLAPHSNPFTGVFHSLAHKHFFNAYISSVAILCEPLIVSLASIPFQPGEAWETYIVSNWLVVAILSMMLIGITWFLCRKKTPGLIRRPDTVASVMLYLCGSHMLKDFKGMARLKQKRRDELVEEWDKRYSMGRFIGMDAVEREGIDESCFVGDGDGRG